MKSIDDIISDIKKYIKIIYIRPKMMGVTAEVVEAKLETYHYLLSYIHDRDEEMLRYRKEICGSIGNYQFPMSDYFKRMNPDCTEDDAISHVIGIWKKIDMMMGKDFVFDQHKE